VDNIHTTMYGDLTKQQLLDLDYAVMNLKERSYEEIPHTGLSSDYVNREAKRALAGVGEGIAGEDADLARHRHQPGWTPHLR
jgi:hypothetical protein